MRFVKAKAYWRLISQMPYQKMAPRSKLKGWLEVIGPKVRRVTSVATELETKSWVRILTCSTRKIFCLILILLLIYVTVSFGSAHLMIHHPGSLASCGMHPPRQQRAQLQSVLQMLRWHQQLLQPQQSPVFPPLPYLHYKLHEIRNIWERLPSANTLIWVLLWRKAW